MLLHVLQEICTVTSIRKHKKEYRKNVEEYKNKTKE